LCDARLNLFASHPTTIYAVIDVDFLKCDGDLIRLVGVGLAGDPRIMEIDLLPEGVVRVNLEITK
jgi:hypothetical protein